MVLWSRMKQEEYLEWEGVCRVGEILARSNARRVFLVTGERAYRESGAEEKLKEVEGAYEVTRFSDFEENPREEDVQKGRDLFRKERYDAVLAVGGGSAIDTAKLVRAGKASDTVDDLIDGKASFDEEQPILIAVPTTAGSGSEATRFAVVSRGKVKHSVTHPSLIPDAAVVDPSLTESMPPRLTAITGLDALSQAVESYWAVGATEESRGYAKEALVLIARSLEEAIHAPTRKAREEMSFGAHYAGKAINISKTTAPHALSYVFTTYFNVSHGLAVALTLGTMIEYNAHASPESVNDPRGADYAQQIMRSILEALGCGSAEEARKKVETILKRADLPTRLSQIGMREQDIELCVQNVNAERLSNHPYRVSGDALRALLRDIL